MIRSRTGWAIAATTLPLLGAVAWTLHAQSRDGARREGSAPRKSVPSAGKVVPGNPRASAVSNPKPDQGQPARSKSVQEALLDPFELPFDQPTSLAEVAEHLREVLRAPVVLDRAALDRQELTADSTVQLALKGVRLKIALKLLLGQVGLTYRVYPEDNLLVLTDAQESDDRYARILDELRSLHRDVHDLQDAVDEILNEEPAGSDPGRTMRISSRRAR